MPILSSFLKSDIDMVLPSAPVLRPFAASHPNGDRTPVSPSLINEKGEPSSSAFAWIQYLLSVQSKASSSVITTVPAEPVNPDMNSRLLHLGETYSL